MQPDAFEMTRRGLWVPMLAGLAAGACAPLLEGRTSQLGPRGWRTTQVSYGSDRHQWLYIARPDQSAQLPLILMFNGPDLTPDDLATARAWADMGYIAAIAARRPSPVPAFPAYVSDGARAFEFLVRHGLELSRERGAISLCGWGEGVNVASLLGVDPRYLDALGVRRHLGHVMLLEGGSVPDATWTHASAYR